jgi:hypothetical protein
VWKHRWLLAVSWLAIVIFTGCASPENDIHVSMVPEKPLRPNHILVHDFAVTPADLPADAPVRARLASGVSVSSEQLAMDRQLSSNMTAQLVMALREIGLPAERALRESMPEVNDVVVQGTFVSMHDTNAVKNLTVGFDFNALEFLTMLEAFQRTPRGVGRRIASPGNPTGIIATSGMKIGDKASARSKLDGWSKQTVKEIVDGLKPLFQEQGWIN